MKITGIETVDGIPMCKAVYESNTKDNNYSKLEYFWSQDGKTSLWNAYDASGKKISEVSMKDGKMRMVDKDGKVTEITTRVHKEKFKSYLRTIISFFWEIYSDNIILEKWTNFY